MRLISLLLALLISKAAFSSTFTLDNPERYLEVIDVVDGGVILTAQRLEELTRKNKEDVTILINSPGGYVSAGFILVDAIEMAKERGVTVKCVSGVLAASMAFILLAHCSERYVLPNTILLFHPIRFGGEGIRIEEVLPSLIELTRRERIVSRYLVKRMGMRWQSYHQHSYSETDWSGRGLANYTAGSNFLTVVDRVEGIDNLFVFRRPRGLFSNYTDTLLIPQKLRSLYK